MADRYDEALARAAAMIELAADKEEARRYAGIIFPELANSEDELMIKALGEGIRDVVKDFGWSDFGGIPIEDVLEWIEKQGESIDKIAERARTEKQRVLVTESDGVANIDWDTRSLQDAKLLMEYGLNYIKKIEKQGEQKSAAWSEEDEKIWKELIEEVKDQLDSVPAPDCRDKEDEKVLKQLNKWLTWLKSLKQRCTWKPSDEQITVLELASKYERVFTHKQIDILIDLKEQLKKLTE